MCILTGIAGICLWFKGAHENGEIALLSRETIRGQDWAHEDLAVYKQRIADLLVPESFKEGDGICLKKPNLMPNEVPVVYLQVQRIKWMADGKGCTIFAGRHSPNRKKETSVGRCEDA
jgi:hypothetical protein